MKNLILITSLFFIIGCQAEFGERNAPIFPSEPPGGKPTFEIRVESQIEPTVIKPTKFRRFIRSIVGWIPIVGDIFEIPMNIVNALLPDLSFSEIIEFPDGSDLSDPEVMKRIDRIVLDQAHLMVTPESLRGDDYRRSKCFIFFKCKDQDLKFIKELVIVIQKKKIKDPKIPSSPKEPNESWIIARATKNELSKDFKYLNIIPVGEVDLRPFLSDVDKYQIQILVDGRIPKRTLYVQGALQLRIRFLYGDAFSGDDKK